MKKKMITLILIGALVVNIFGMNVFAATDEETYAGNQLKILGVFKGYSDGSLKLDNKIIRAEVATLMVRVLGYEGTVVLGNEKNFTDVKKDYWAYNEVQNSYKLGVFSGYPTGEFKPTKEISYAEVVAIMVNALGKNKDLQGTWPNNYLDKGKALGIIPANSAVEPNKAVTRGEMAVIIWNTLLIQK